MLLVWRGREAPSPLSCLVSRHSLGLLVFLKLFQVAFFADVLCKSRRVDIAAIHPFFLDFALCWPSLSVYLSDLSPSVLFDFGGVRVDSSSLPSWRCLGSLCSSGCVRFSAGLASFLGAVLLPLSQDRVVPI